MKKFTIFLLACTTLSCVSKTPDRERQDAQYSIENDSVKVEKLSSGFKFTEGPAVDASGNVYFTDIPNNTIFIWTTDNRLDTFTVNSGSANGLYFDDDQNLLACVGQFGQVCIMGPDGVIAAVAAEYMGNRFNQTNDLWIDPNGGVYFTDPKYGDEENLPQDGMHVYYVNAGRTSVTRVCDDYVKPNGIIGTPDGKILYVTDARAGGTYRYDIQEDGNLKNKTLFAEPGCDGMTIDVEGNLYLTTGGEHGIDVYSPDGELIRSIDVPEKPSNVCFGGKDRDQLFITARTSIYRISMDTKGVD